MVSGICWGTTPVTAKFYGLTSYSCDKGAEFIESNPVQFRNFTIWDQFTESIAGKTIINNQIPDTSYRNLFYDSSKGTVLADSVIIGNSLGGQQRYTPIGLSLAWDRGQLVDNVAFYNFPTNESFGIRGPIIDGRCFEACGGWTTSFRG